jgi:hypothetical protein
MWFSVVKQNGILVEGLMSVKLGIFQGNWRD